MQRAERLIGQIAARQDDVVSRAQLVEAGLARGEIDGRIARGQLRRRHRGIYLTGHAPPSTRTLARAALLACGEGAVISHGTAAALWGLAAPPVEAEVTVSGRNPGPKPGIRIHRVATLHPSEVRVLQHGLRITSPARTICDLAATSPRREVEHALQEAIVRRLLGEAQLGAVLAKAPARPGAAVMRDVLALERGPCFTRSAAERALMRILDGGGLPRPEKNVRILGQLVDALWRAPRLVVEVDGRLAHDHQLAFERDRRRHQALVAAGWRVIRLTFRQLRDEPLMVAARLAQALAAAA
ncbi:MAG: DUF559 domain-containing protein [Actinomycetota bacterium]|nr:DUF559 domain-containing protein [Actinomycetota bacterium]